MSYPISRPGRSASRMARELGNVRLLAWIAVAALIHAAIIAATSFHFGPAEGEEEPDTSQPVAVAPAATPAKAPAATPAGAPASTPAPAEKATAEKAPPAAPETSTAEDALRKVMESDAPLPDGTKARPTRDLDDLLKDVR